MPNFELHRLHLLIIRFWLGGFLSRFCTGFLVPWRITGIVRSKRMADATSVGMHFGTEWFESRRLFFDSLLEGVFIFEVV